MKKSKIKFKKSYKFALVILLLIGIFTLSLSSTFAYINSSSIELGNDSGWDVILNVVQKLVDIVGNVAMGAILKMVQVLIVAVAAGAFLLLYTLWGALGGSLIDLPFPDKIVFNQMAMFDPNFINPTPDSALKSWATGTNIIKYFTEPVKNIYFSLFIIAGLIMVIAALIIGIKLAITSIASEKAQYKETLNKWIMGMVLLFSLHFIILGEFTINEEICKIASKSSTSIGVCLNFDEYNIVTKAVNGVHKLFNTITDFFTGNNTSENTTTLNLTASGLGGILFYQIIQVVLTSDILAAMCFLCLIGQTLNLIVHYTKRFFYIIFLAMLGPLVVAVDVIKRVI